MALEIVPLVEGDKTGAEARVAGRRVAHLLARLDEAPSRGKHAWASLGDHSVAASEPAELAADVYAAAGQAWLERGHLTHLVEVPADEEALRVWFALGFGQEQVYARAPTRAEAPPPPERLSIRRAAPDDLDRALELADAIWRHQIGPPVWSGLPLPTWGELRSGWAELLADAESAVFLAEEDGAVVGYLATAPADERGVLHLPVAATREHARRRGVGSALLAHALHRAHRDGFAHVELDWRSANLLASRFWRRHGFVPTHYRLRRDVQPYA